MTNLVEPLSAAPTAPEVTPTDPNAVTAPVEKSPAPQAETGADLPNEILQIPAFAGLLTGQPAALSANLADFAKRPEGILVSKNKDALLGAGIGLYRSIAGDIGVIFNQSYVAGEDLVTADKNGTLAEVAPDFDQVNAQLASSGTEHPILSADMNALPTGPKTPGAPSITPMPPMAPSAAPAAGPVPQRTVGAKLRNLVTGGPTSGPSPGAGRILNSILKPVL